MPNKQKFDVEFLKSKKNSENIQKVLTLMYNLRKVNDAESALTTDAGRKAADLISDIEIDVTKYKTSSHSIQQLQSDFVAIVSAADIGHAQKNYLIALMCTTPEVFDNVYSRNATRISCLLFIPLFIWRYKVQSQLEGEGTYHYITGAHIEALVEAFDLAGIPIALGAASELYPDRFPCLFNRQHISRDAKQFAYVMQAIASAKLRQESNTDIANQEEKKFFVAILKSQANTKNLQVILSFIKQLYDESEVMDDSIFPYTSAAELLDKWQALGPELLPVEVKNLQKIFISVVNNSTLSREVRDTLIAKMSSNPVVYDNFIQRNIGKIALLFFILEYASITMVLMYLFDLFHKPGASKTNFMLSRQVTIVPPSLIFACIPFIANSVLSRTANANSCLFNTSPIYSDARQFAHMAKGMARTIESLGYKLDENEPQQQTSTKMRFLL